MPAKRIRKPETATNRMLAARRNREAAYSERNLLLAILTRIYPTHLMRFRPTEEAGANAWEWVICMHTPEGQCGWHLPSDEINGLFDHLERIDTNHWDGHTRAEKARRLERLAHAAQTVPE